MCFFYLPSKQLTDSCFVCFKKEHGLDNELMNLALLSSPRDMLDVARSVLQFVLREFAIVKDFKPENCTPVSIHLDW